MTVPLPIENPVDAAPCEEINRLHNIGQFHLFKRDANLPTVRLCPTACTAIVISKASDLDRCGHTHAFKGFAYSRTGGQTLAARWRS